MSVEEIHLRDQQIEEQLAGMRERLAGLDESNRRDLDLDDVADGMAQVQNGLDSFLMEMKGLPPDIKKNYKRKLKEHKKELEAVRNEHAWKTEQSNRSELLGEQNPVSATHDFDTEQGVIAHGKDVLNQSDQSLQRTLAKVAETRVIAVDTATKIQEQTNQIEGMYDDLYNIDDTLKRSTAIIKRMFRKVRTDKYIWVMIFLVVAAVIFILVYKAVGGGDDDDGLQTPSSRRRLLLTTLSLSSSSSSLSSSSSSLSSSSSPSSMALRLTLRLLRRGA